MLDFNPHKTNCMGCSACYTACPVHCITMTPDEEGFQYPSSSDACIDCKLCQKVCPMVKHKQDNPHPQKAYAAVSKDYAVWKRSASGGSFSEICRNWADKDTLIVGAAWDGLKVHHIGEVGFDNIAPLCKSKYISSAIEDTFIEIRNHLKEGKKVIFCGCPCQVDGLKSSLRKDYDNLLTIDLICHGQGSPLVFEECIRHMSKHFGKQITAYEFRTKRNVYERDYLTYIAENQDVTYLSGDPYMQLFLSQNALRPSCGENCKYRDRRRPGDLTIADCKGLSNIFPDLEFAKYNYSTIVSNTPKGEQCALLLNKTMEVRSYALDDVIKYNPLFARQTWFSKDRDQFFADFQQDPQAAITKWTKPYSEYKSSILRTVYQHLPLFVKHIIRKSYLKIKK